MNELNNEYESDSYGEPYNSRLKYNSKSYIDYTYLKQDGYHQRYEICKTLSFEQLQNIYINGYPKLQNGVRISMIPIYIYFMKQLHELNIEKQKDITLIDDIMSKYNNTRDYSICYRESTKLYFFYTLTYYNFLHDANIEKHDNISIIKEFLEKEKLFKSNLGMYGINWIDKKNLKDIIYYLNYQMTKFAYIWDESEDTDLNLELLSNQCIELCKKINDANFWKSIMKYIFQFGFNTKNSYNRIPEYEKLHFLKLSIWIKINYKIKFNEEILYSKNYISEWYESFDFFYFKDNNYMKNIYNIILHLFVEPNEQITSFIRKCIVNVKNQKKL